MARPSTEHGVRFPRIPGGQHGLPPDVVRDDQLARIHAATVQTVARSGYLATTVEDIISAAGVSRRTYYENFPNKQEGMLAACGVAIEGWMREGERAYHEAVKETPGDLRSRLRAALRALFDLVERDPLGARLIFLEQLNCGSAGVENLERVLQRLEELLAVLLQGTDRQLPLAPEMIKVLVGGVLETITLRMRRDRTHELRGLLDDEVDWILSYRSAAARDLLAGSRWQETIMATPPDVEDPASKDREDDSPDTPFWAKRPLTIAHPRARILHETTRFVSRYGYLPLSVRTICEATRLSHNTFRKYFKSSEEAFLQAYRLGGQEVIAYSLGAFAAEEEWENAVHAGLTAELRFMAMRPDIARIGFLEVYAAGPEGLKLRDAELHMFTVALDPGQRRAPHLPRVFSEMIAGAIYYLCRTFLLENSPEQLPTLTPIAIYTALAPYIGAEAAADIAAKPLSHRR